MSIMYSSESKPSFSPHLQTYSINIDKPPIRIDSYLVIRADFRLGFLKKFSLPLSCLDQLSTMIVEEKIKGLASIGDQSNPASPCIASKVSSIVTLALLANIKLNRIVCIISALLFSMIPEEYRGRILFEVSSSSNDAE